MSEQVARKKSYRWVSAGQASYDGADWDSSDDEQASYDEEATPGNMIKKQNTISRLPALPKLQYSDDDDDTVENVGETKDYIEGSQEEALPQTVKPQAVIEENREIINKAWESPRLTKVISRNSSSSSARVKRTPVNEDLENLMLQISKEMTPKLVQSENFDEDVVSSHSHEFDRLSNTGLERNPIGETYSDEDGPPPVIDDISSGSQSSGDERDDVRPSKGGYFSNYIASDDDEEDVSEVEKEQAILSRPIEHGQSRKDNGESDNERSGSDSESETVSSALPTENRVSVVEIDHSRSPIAPRTSYEGDYSSDGGDEDFDALSYTESIKYEKAPVDEHESLSDKPIEDVGSQDDEESSGIEDLYSSDEDIQVSKSGYFKKMVDSDVDSNNSNHEGQNEEDALTIPETIATADEVSSKDEPIEKEADQGLVDDKVKSDKEEKCEEEGRPGGKLKESSEFEGEGELEGQKEPTPNQENKALLTRQSINLGNWKPDTGAYRSGFVQETSNNPPPGYVYDESGKLIDLTPSSMKPRVVSTYSEVESSWNAFPSEGNDDLETIKDTKTLYDNNTVHNVPGIISNNQNVPPLPELSQGVRSDENSDGLKSPGTGHSTSTTFDGEGNKGPLQTHFKEVFTVPEPDSKEIARVTEQSKVPYLDLNKVLMSKNAHAYKIRQLRDYSKQLNGYDTGIQTWLSYTLKSSSKTDRDFIFDEYKVSKHVRDAYANADELSRKHTVINTVASVNQNVSHLTKKVFAHSKKSRGLFSSIGKKKV